MKRYSYFLIIIIILNCSYSDSDEPTEEELRIQKEIDNMVLEYNAIADWEQTLKGGDVFTIDLQNKIVRTNDRPILITAILEDIVAQDDSYLMRFTHWNISSDINFYLNCDESIAQKIIKQERTNYMRFAIIAKISNIKKIDLSLSVETKTDETDDYEYPEQFIELYPSFTFNAYGTLLDFVKY